MNVCGGSASGKAQVGARGAVALCSGALKFARPPILSLGFGVSVLPEVIDDCPSCGIPLDVTGLAPFSSVVCPGCGETVRVMRGFGPYELVRRHAVGGMSMVFAARDRMLGREVALKILGEDFSGDERRIAAFEQEARLTASFSHPNVVRVYTTGRGFGRFYIAMELVPGDHFEHQIRERGRIPEREVLALAIEVAQGLRAAHAAGLIHRDVKPGNILIDAEGHAKLVDFGLALVTQGGTARATEIWATPFYVPPETVEGHAEDFRSDIYAFGATLYHALSGSPPCGGDWTTSEALLEAKKHIAPLGMAAPWASTATCRLVDRAMAHDPAARFDSYDELIAALKEALADVQSGMVGTDIRRVKSARTGRWLAAAALVTAGLAAAALWIKRQGTQVPPVARQQPITVVAPSSGMADSSAEIAQGYRAARAAVEARDFQTAEREFAALHEHPDVQEPTRSWTGLEAMLSAWLDDREADALRRVPGLREHLQKMPASHPLAGPEWDALLAGMDGLAPLAAPAAKTPAATVLAAMLAGLKNWNQGMMDQASECFTSATAVRCSDDEEWAAVYQKLAADHLDDHRLLLDPVFDEEPADPAGHEAASARLGEILSGLKTRGRARFNVRARQLEIDRRRKLAADTDMREAPAVATPAIEPVTPAAMMAKLAGFSGERRFAEASEWLQTLPDGPDEDLRAALLHMTRAATLFLTDIARDLGRGPLDVRVAVAGGLEARRVSASGGGITVTMDSGDTQGRAWRDFPADSLIAIHRALVARGADGGIGRELRHERAIAFDWLAGNRERAQTAAAKLSLTSPHFKKRWESVSAGLPQ